MLAKIQRNAPVLAVLAIIVSVALAAASAVAEQGNSAGWEDPGPIELSRARLAADEHGDEVEADDPLEPSLDAPEPEVVDTAPPPPSRRRPLMELLTMAGVGEPMESIGLDVYGWVETSFTGILRGPGGSRRGLPLRVYEENKPDNLKMNQLALIIERALDYSQPFDIGFRVDPMFGADSQVNASYGLLDRERGTHSFDLAQLYVQVWVATGDDGQGFELTVGKWYTTIGSEVVPSPENWLVSRSMLFGFGPFSHVGGLLTYHFNDQFNIHVGISRGWDQWKNLNDGVSFHAGFGWDSKELMGDVPRSQFSFAYIGGPEGEGRGHPQNRHIWNAVWTYMWTEKLTQMIDGYFAWEDDVPDAVNRRGFARRRDSAWYGIAYTLNYQINDYLDTTGRFEWFVDQYGVRTGGYRGNFMSYTHGLGIKPFPDDPWLSGLLIRPEFRMDWSSNNEPFVGGSRSVQMTAALSVVYAF